jgi:hypothetical protein
MRLKIKQAQINSPSPMDGEVGNPCTPDSALGEERSMCTWKAAKPEGEKMSAGKDGGGGVDGEARGNSSGSSWKSWKSMSMSGCMIADDGNDGGGWGRKRVVSTGVRGKDSRTGELAGDVRTMRLGESGGADDDVDCRRGGRAGRGRMRRAAHSSVSIETED